ncbi:Nuclear pore complex, rNpl4 component (sc Npl4) [Plasmopara halstedii]|uniref:Nuclear pore complex, rNpl4 component (Sc Npl4) n=1 Tax=Plasmopara halstedii TaxID=4781 RepID=A0A0P1A5Q7_PLAHL|nr:Nuclear pore complex, rNpl4 component (sc Npl4) [Plasmopara halstedii]CEG35354.1 Nuclear pore complex, rNpl4 component (sc Npl4) [Plasmopara halstedii]|eukprot:XP_024571723.1 Nuclear pore complex, rNpl4 component (sc Npl4) [Plasmopara halstedii]
MIIRVRSKNGIWRIENLTPSSTIADIKLWIFEQHSIAPTHQRLTLDQQATMQTADTQTLRTLQLGHGDMLFLDYEGQAVATGGTIGTKINADGTLTRVEYHDRADKQAFRPGMKSLRDMKMHWSLGEFMRMDAQFEFKLTAQKEPEVTKVHLDGASCNDFQAYLRQFAFQQSRCGWLYGSVNSETKEVTVDFIYEPPQEGNPYGFEVLDDLNAEKVDAISEALGCEKVGWIFSHPPREDSDFHFSVREILLAAQLQADAGGKSSLFLTLKVTLDKQGQASFEAFQVSNQCVEMFAAGALMENDHNPKACAINDTFTALVEAKPATEVDNNFFLCVVPVVPHASPLRCEFPKINREGVYQTRAALKYQLQKYSSEPFVKRISDFQLLVFLADFLDIATDIPAICLAIRDLNVSLDSGYQILIDSVADTH